jgi:penicillin-binding protein 1B
VTATSGDPAVSGTRPAPDKKTPARKRRRGWKFYALLGAGVPLLVVSVVVGYYYVVFSRMIDARIHGEMQRTDPRVFARPFELRPGQALTPRQLDTRLNDLGYSHRARAEEAGEFAIGRDTMVLVPREGDRKGKTVRIVFGRRTAKGEVTAIDRIELVPGNQKIQKIDRVTLEAPLITALVTTAREKRRDVPLAAIPQRMMEAVLAIEDRRFYAHPGVDPIAIVRAVFSNMFGDQQYLVGGSTITQQLVKNTFLTPEKSPTRKMKEWLMSVVLERRLSKDQILELYLNDVSLGQRGSFAIHGVGEAARLFFGKDLSNITVSEAATIAGVIQSPPRHSPFNNPDKSRDRRNVVLKTMAAAGFISADAAARATREPLQVATRSLENEAPFFVDYISRELQDRYKVTGAVDVYTTLDVHLQKIAQDAVRDGLVRIDAILARRKRRPAQAALVATATGAVRAARTTATAPAKRRPATS